jgi:hypothetical protein
MMRIIVIYVNPMPIPIKLPRNAGLRLWGWPLLLGLLSASGLVSALISDGWGDVWSWLALGLPVLLMALLGWRRPAR